MKPSKILVMAFLCLVLNTYGQQIKPLSIGDTIPDITLNNIIHYKDTSAKLSDFKGKPVIIDFFATWCSSCIAALPHLDSLQKRFGDSIQILIVTYEPTNKLKSFLNTNKKAQEVNLVFITEDTILKSFFPHKLIPHEIVIKNRQVKAITYPEYLTEETMTTLLSDAPIDIPVKKDLLKFDSEKTLEENGSIENQIIFHSMLTHYLEGFGFKTSLNKKDNSKKMVFTNAPILFLYQIATSMNEDGFKNRIVLEVKDKNKFINPENSTKKAQWHERAKRNNYCYEIIVPKSTSDSLMKKLMLQDLNRYLGLNGRVEKRKVKCMKLVFNSPEDSTLIKTKGGNPNIKIDKRSELQIIKNYPMSVLLAVLNNQAIPYPLHSIIVDRTNYKGNVDLSLELNDIQDLSSLSKALVPYGLKLIPGECNLDVLVITENK